MAEEEIPKTLEEMQEERAKEEIEKTQRRELIRKETLERLRTDEKIQEYFKQFNPHSIDGFISSYAMVKARWMVGREATVRMNEHSDLKFITPAMACIWDIQKKKLFDLECQWRAEQIELAESESTWDFYGWMHDIKNCPIVPPITDAEFDLYMQYAQSAEFEVDSVSFFSYDSWKMNFMNLFAEGGGDDDEGDEDTRLPEWFMFHNQHTGNSQYLLLPNTRKEKEEHYMDYWRKWNQEEIEKKYASGEFKRPIPAEVAKPMLSNYDRIQMEAFMKKFEDQKTLDAYRADLAYFDVNKSEESEEDDTWLSEQAESAYYALMDAKDKVPVKASTDWREALMEAWDNYFKQRVLQELPYAYADYKMRTGTGLGWETDSLHAGKKATVTQFKNYILHGRELAGEPKDWNF